MNDQHRSNTTAEAAESEADLPDPNQLKLLLTPEDTQVPEQPSLPFTELAVA